MPSSRGRAAFLVCALALASSVSAGAQQAPIDFSAIGDAPYSDAEALQLEGNLEDHNRFSPSEFLVHVGDILGPTELCAEPNYVRLADVLRPLAVPAFVVPGDNEWNDCADPAQGWVFWERHFADFEQQFCGAPAVEAQAVRPENFAFVEKGVLFIGINLVGGRVHDPAEWNLRMQQDVDWIEAQLASHGSETRGAVIFAQAGPDPKRDLFFNPFVAAAAAFGKPVLYLHGDGHEWLVDRPFSSQNVLRVQLPQGRNAPLQVTVSLDPADLFRLQPNPWPSGTPALNRPPCVDAGPDLVLAPGQTALLEGLVSDDGDPAPPATLSVAWSKVSGPGTVAFQDPSSPVTTASLSSQGSYVLRLLADDGALATSDDLVVQVGSSGPSLEIDDATVAEGDAGTVQAVFTVRLLFPDSQSVSVDYATSDGTARADSDYQSATGGLTLSASAPSAEIRVNVNGDPDPEADETFLVTLANPSHGVLGDGGAVGRILDDDQVVVDPFTLVVATEGIGSVALSPPGGIYQPGTVVTLTANPGSGSGFAGWSGNLTGVANPATLVMDADKALTARFELLPPPGTSAVTLQELQTGISSGSATVATSAGLTAVAADLYLAGITYKPNAAVTGVSGLGLAWTPLRSQCGGRHQTGISLWMAQGTPTASGPVAATLGSVPTNAAIAVARFSGVSPTDPVGGVASANTLGLGGACDGGTDTNVYAFPLTTTAPGSRIFALAAMRNRTHTPGLGYLERLEVQAGSGGDAAGLAAAERSVDAASTVPVEGSFSSTVDWAVVAAEIREPALPPQPFTLSVATQGSGSVALSPPGGVYDAGTVVTLTATPASGSAFTGWSGALSGTANPAILTMDANQAVTASFTPIPPEQFTLSVATQGSGSVALSPPGGVYDAGTVVTLTATPASGSAFTGWSGDLTGVANPATLVMDADKAVTARFELLPPVGNSAVTLEELQTGISSGSATVATSAGLTAVAADLYLAGITYKPNAAVTGVSGLGLAWTPLRSQCGGRHQTGISLWMAQGTPTASGPVAATLGSVPTNAAIAVARFSGVSPTDPVGGVASANTLGLGGACDGGTDTNVYAFPLTTTAPGSRIFALAAMRNRTHTPGLGYLERLEVQAGSGGGAAALAASDRSVDLASTVPVEGSFSSTVDWAVVAAELRAPPPPASPAAFKRWSCGLGGIDVPLALPALAWWRARRRRCAT